MAVVDELVTLIGYKLDERGAAILKAAKSEVVDMTKKVAGLSVAVIAGKTAFQGWFSGVLENSMQLQKLSDDTNISTESLQAWGYAVGRMGGDAKGALGNLQAFQRGLHSIVPGQFNQGLALILPEYLQGQVKTLDEALDLLSKKWTALANQGPEGKLKAFREANIAGLNDDNARLLMQGPKGLAEMRQLFNELNGGIGNEKQVKANAELWQSFYDLKTSIKGYASQLTGELTPYLKDAVDVTNEWIKKNRELHKEKLGFAIETAKEVPGQTVNSWQSFKNDIEAIGNAERQWFENLRSHYPHITGWIRNMGTIMKDSFNHDFDVFGRMYQGIKEDGKKIIAFLSEMGEAVGKVFKAGLWVFDKYLGLFGNGSDYKLPNLFKNEGSAQQVNPWQTMTVPQPTTAKTVTQQNKIDIHVTGAQSPVATAKVVKNELGSLGYFLNPAYTD